MIPHVPEIILEHVLPFAMVMFRIAGMFVYAPLFGSRVIPVRLKALLVLALSFAVYGSLSDSGALTWSNQWGVLTLEYAAMPSIMLMIAVEMAIGIVIGFGASLPLIAMQVSGMIMGQQMGLGLAQVLNPEFNEQSEITGQLLFWGALIVFLLIDGHHGLMLALMNSFKSIPLAGFSPDAELFSFIMDLVWAMMELAFRVSAPLLCIVFLESIALGFVAKTVPQLNILSLGFPLRIVIGIMTLIFLTTPILTLTGDEMLELVQQMIEYFSRPPNPIPTPVPSPSVETSVLIESVPWFSVEGLTPDTGGGRL